jgi:multiple sugar transport system substrate-binding protein
MLLACTPQGSKLTEPITLTFTCQRSELGIYQTAAEAFQQANPSIEVHVIPLDQIVSFPLEDETDTLGPVRQLASQADAFIWSTDAVEGGPPGLVLDLTTFVEADDEPTEDDFLPGLWDHVQWQGRTWGLPVGVDPLVLLYDPTAFEAAGVKPPAPGWSWEELFSAAQQLTRREGEQVMRYGLADFSLDGLRSAIEAQRGQLVDDSVASTLPTLDDPRTVAAVQWYADLALTHNVMANPAEKKFVDDFSVVQSGEAAMSVSLSRFWGSEERDDGLRVAPLPESSPVWLYGYFISAGTARPEAAWHWLKFLSQQVTLPDRLPARRSLIPGSAYAFAAGEEALETFRYAAEHALPPMHPAAVEELLRQAVERVFEGQKVEDALAEAQAQALSLSVPEASEQFVVPTPVPTKESVESITFVTFDRRPYKPLVERFHETHPKIEVTVREAIDFGYYGGPPAKMLKTSGADCFVATDLASASSETWRVVSDLQPFIDAEPDFSLDDYLPWTLERVRYSGDLWGLPAGVSVDVLWYNPTLFDQAGLSYPKRDWSWNDVFFTADKLSADEGDKHRYGFLFGRHKAVFLLQGLSGPLMDINTAPLTFHFDDPDVIAAAQQLANLAQKRTIPTPREGNPTYFHNLIRDDKVGMWLGRAKVELERKDWRPVPLPAAGRCLVSARSSTAYYIAADSLHAEACWEWLRFLSDRVLLVENLPPRQSLLVSDTFREQVGTEAQSAYQTMLTCENQGGVLGLLQEKRQHRKVFEFWLRPALEKVIWHSADAQVELSEAQRKAEAYLECLRQRDDPEDEASAQACFEKVDAQ